MASASDSAIASLDTVQRQAGRIITGCTRDTRNDVLDRLSNLPSFQIRAKLHASILFERAAHSANNNPLAVCSKQSAHRNRDGALRLKFRSWRESAIERVAEAGLNELQREETQIVGSQPPWHPVDAGTITFKPPLQDNTSRNDEASRRKLAALTTWADLPEADIVLWTDAAASGGITDGGGGVVICRKGQPPEVISIPTGRITASYRSEMLAIQRAVTACASNPPGEQLTIRICTDSQSALHHLRQAPSGQKGQAAQDTWAGIRNLATMDHNVHVQWVPGHAGLDGNEAADADARVGTQLDQQTVTIELRCAQNHLERHFFDKWEAS